MPTDIEIAQSAKLKPILEIADACGIPRDAVSPYGKYMAKLDPALIPKRQTPGQLVLVTAINPTPAGEGKTTVSIALADGMRREGMEAMLALREPSLGPVFGVKGGAAGGGYAQVVPMESINLHFTGDLHAITSANNLLCAMADNHIFQGNALGIDPRQVTVRRCMDMNDRQLRSVLGGLGGKTNGMPREDGFDITTASEVMAVFCLANDLSDLKARLARILVGYTYGGEPVTAGDLKAQGAMAALLKDAISPNLVQSLEGTPALVHGGPFANIAHGCNSVIATRLALSMADYVVTEAGFGADLGAEKFIDIKCRAAGLMPGCVVVVATVRALKSHGGVVKAELGAENVEALKAGLPNLLRHIRNVTQVWNLPCVVALNRFVTDTEAELNAVIAACEEQGAKVSLCEGWGKGGEGARDLARSVGDVCAAQSEGMRFTYEAAAPLKDKIRAVATRVYGAANVVYAPGVITKLNKIAQMGYGDAPICVAKTQYSFSDDPKKLGAPEGFDITVKNVRLSAGAGFVVVYTGDIIAMPGLPKVPAAQGIDVSDEGVISGLF